MTYWIRCILLSTVSIVAFAIPLSAMDFGFGFHDRKSLEKKDPSAPVIWMTGEIREGDYARFHAFVSNNFDRIISVQAMVSLSSNGGNVVEALKMAALIRAMYATVFISHGERCASSCFYLYVAGVDRSAADSGSIGVHRAYFNSSYFAGLSPADAEKRQAELTKAVSDYLEKAYVPRSIIEKMNAMSSNDILWLDSGDEYMLGFPYQPWYEQLLIAKCGYSAEKQKHLYQSDHAAWEVEVTRMHACEFAFKEAELKRTLLTFLLTADPSKKVQPQRTSR